MIQILQKIYCDMKVARRLKEAAGKRPSASEQVQRAADYRKANKRLAFSEVGFSCHSQYEEDGILLYIFALIGTLNKKSVELCSEDGFECNTANLILNHGWQGLLCEGGAWNTYKAQRFYDSHPKTQNQPPVVLHKWVTRENVNALLKENGYEGEVDLLSLDMDGVDYWILKELSVIRPRVIVLEFNHLWGPDTAVTVPYRDDFKAEFSKWGCDYGGASLKAFVDLSREKGYRLIGTNAIATNAFFLRNDIPCDFLPEVDPKTCFDHPRAQFGMKERLPRIKEKEWVYL